MIQRMLKRKVWKGGTNLRRGSISACGFGPRESVSGLLKSCRNVEVMPECWGRAGMFKSCRNMARLSSQYSNNLNMQYIYYISLPYFLFPFCSCFILLLYFSFCFYIFYISSYYFIYTCLAHLFFILYSLSYMRSIFFIFIPYFFLFREGFFIFFLISMQHVITWPRCTFPTISKAKWRMEL